MLKLETAWDTSCKAWSLDDGKDAQKTVELGERMMYAATDLINELQVQLDILEHGGC
jgi:hypothetical protein